ncbi:MAG: hypothetical protein Q8K83_07875 [Methylotenera sp.]|nr:hypothetical protein [Methylotenera sp.]
MIVNIHIVALYLKFEQFKPLLATDRNDGLPPLVNIGTGEDVTIKQLAELVSSVVGYSGALEFDSTKPDGTMRKLMDVSFMRSLGLQAATSLGDGLVLAYKNHLTNK